MRSLHGRGSWAEQWQVGWVLAIFHELVDTHMIEFIDKFTAEGSGVKVVHSVAATSVMLKPQD